MRNKSELFAVFYSYIISNNKFTGEFWLTTIFCIISITWKIYLSLSLSLSLSSLQKKQEGCYFRINSYLMNKHIFLCYKQLSIFSCNECMQRHIKCYILSPNTKPCVFSHMFLHISLITQHLFTLVT